MSAETIEITPEAMEALIKRVDSAQENQLSLDVEDIRLILQILRHFAFMQEKLDGNQVMKQKYLKLLGLIGSSETQQQLFNRPSTNKPKSSPRRQPKPPSTPMRPPEVQHHSLDSLEKGQRCPECDQGRLYKFEPACFVRIVGSPPLSGEKHVLEQLRCNACGRLFTAPLPESVRADGHRGQKYGYSARAVMSINKFSMGNPYYRQGNFQRLLGVTISASAIYDQCAQTADPAKPIFAMMKSLSANAAHFHLDDTGHRILEQEPIEKPKRKGKGTRRRTGVYTSGLIATLASGESMVLFQTNIGHAGEWIDEILAQRNPDLSAPIVMSDALSSNRPQAVRCEHTLCNSHGRRKFVEQLSNFPEAVAWVLERYAQIWQYDKTVESQALSAIQRRDYHQKYSLPVMAELKAWGQAQLQQPSVEANSGLGKAIRYFLKHYEGLTAFCRMPGAQLDNNWMERVLKLIATSRKNAYFYKTLAGAEVGDILCSLIATCELNGVNIFDYLVAIQRYAWQVSRHPDQWLPWNYHQAMDEQVKVA